MKIALTVQGDGLDGKLDSRFGRAANFLIFDDAARTTQLIPNIQNLNALQGAGIQAAVSVAATGASVLVTGHCGPKAFRVLETAGIKVYTTTASTVSEALKAFEKGELLMISSADVEGHWI